MTLVERGNMDDISLNSLDPCGPKKACGVGRVEGYCLTAPVRQIPPLYRLESRLSARRCAKQGHRLKMLICITHCPLTEGIMTNKGRCLRGDYWDYCYFPLIHTAHFICLIYFFKFLTIGGFCFAEILINWVFLTSFALIPCIFLGTWQCKVILNEELKPMKRANQSVLSLLLLFFFHEDVTAWGFLLQNYNSCVSCCLITLKSTVVDQEKTSAYSGIIVQSKPSSPTLNTERRATSQWVPFL